MKGCDKVDMDLSYFLENKSRGAEYISRAMTDLSINVSEDTTVLELFGAFNGIFARAIDIMLEEIKESKSF
jgi:hypothetical protein